VCTVTPSLDGKSVRATVPRSTLGQWVPSTDRSDPIALLEASNEGRIPELIPIRYGRMLESPFAFLRGAATIMAHDLATTPSTGIRVQLCGDAHLLNFGLYASPERNLVFDVNDFDETFPGPFEWDVKRLATSAVVAARARSFPTETDTEVARVVGSAYRQQMREFAQASPLDVWYHRQDADQLIRPDNQPALRKQAERVIAKARRQTSERVLKKLVVQEGNELRIADQPPLLEHPKAAELSDDELGDLLEQYATSLPPERRVLLGQFRPVDFARKVVGVGSVGTRCFIGLLVSDRRDPLFLQIKEAPRSAMERLVGPSAFEHQGVRVVHGQRIMQTTSDIFLGWMRSKDADFYVRQYKDMKASADVMGMSVPELSGYLELCAATLAHSHARSGVAAAIAAYLGRGDPFDRALVRFAVAYADQNQRDYEALKHAEASGRVHAASPV
jgi:uncharacterized protein (DUF2252 family)